MGQKVTKQKPDVIQLSEDEWNSVNFFFEWGDSNDLTGVTSDALEYKWSPMLTEKLKIIWIAYVFPHGNVINTRRFQYLVKGHTSHFLDLRAASLFRIILNVDPDVPVSFVATSLIVEYTEQMIDSYVACLGHYENDDFMRWIRLSTDHTLGKLKTLSTYLMNELVLLNKPIPSLLEGRVKTKKVSVREVETWIRKQRIMSEIISELLEVAFGLLDIGTSPCVFPKPVSSNLTILNASQVIFLCSQLTKRLTRLWRLRFHNFWHGSNFTMLCNNIVGVGPTIIIIRDNGGHVFGCFASESWKAYSDFYGNIRSFMFQLHPVMKKYAASDYNSNFQYHNQNQYMLPNGFGMGGQLHFFGLWIDGDFGNGKCSDFCSTFANYERPSSATHFTFDHIEVWSVTEDEEGDDLMSEGMKSIGADYSIVSAANPFLDLKMIRNLHENTLL